MLKGSNQSIALKFHRVSVEVQRLSAWHVETVFDTDSSTGFAEIVFSIKLRCRVKHFARRRKLGHLTSCQNFEADCRYVCKFHDRLVVRNQCISADEFFKRDQSRRQLATAPVDRASAVIFVAATDTKLGTTKLNDVTFS
jgi:hypothetical protein